MHNIIFFPGYIGRLKLQIPVRYIKSQPWVIQIDQLYVVAGPAQPAPVSLTAIHVGVIVCDLGVFSHATYLVWCLSLRGIYCILLSFYVHVHVEVCQDIMHTLYVLPKLCVANASMMLYQTGCHLPKKQSLLNVHSCLANGPLGW